MPRVLRTLQANMDLLEIWCAVAEENIDAADKLLESFSSKLQTLATQLMMGRLREEFSRPLRSFSTGKYVIFYQPIDDEIEVIRVLHGSRDLRNLL